MNLNDRNILVTRPRGRSGYRGNCRRNYKKVKEVQMGACAKLKLPKKSNCRASATMSSSNINWKTPISNKNNSMLHTSTRSSNTKSDVMDDESRIIVALSEGRGNATNEVGIAAINITEPSIVLCQIPDLQSYMQTITKLNILKPVEILIPMTCVNSNRLTEIIKSKFPNVKITAVSRTWYNNTSGFQYLTDLCASHWKSTLLTVKHKFYALVAFNALINYLLMELNISYGKESLKVDFQVPDGRAIIDASTADNLELVTTRRAIYHRYSSLMGVLNHCKTKVGARLLRATILQPPSEVDEINSRLDCVQELMDNPGLLTKIQDSLFKLSSIHQLLSVSILTSTSPSTIPTTTTNPSPPNASQRHLNYLITLNGFLQQSNPLREALADCRHKYLSTLRALLEMPVIEDLRQLIGTLMCDDAVKVSGQHGGLGRVGLEYCAFVIKPGVCALLDVVRTTYTDKIAAMREYVKSLSNKYGLPLTLSNTTKKGYHMVMQINKNQRLDFKKSSLPKEFIQIDRLIGSVTMKTAELINSADRTEDMLNEIIKLSNIILSKTLVEIRKHCDVFYLVCEYIAKIDMMQSLAEASSIGQTVRPRFGAYTQVIESRHPLLCYLRPQEPNPNDIHISPWYNLNVITGANGSGKSIYIRQVILIQVMAQVGCFVPAKRAIFRVADRILARVSLNDDMENSASGFVLEMREIDYFLTVLTDNTLIVIDELGRSTSLEAGSAIAFAICKKLLSTKAFTFITTHFALLPKIQNMYLNVKNWYMETLETHTNLIDNKYPIYNFTYTLKSGVVKLKGYGLYFARICWPKDVIEDVERAMAEDEAHWEDKLPEVESIHPLIRLKYDCEADLQLLPRKTVDTIGDRLVKYRQDCKILLKEFNMQETKPDDSVCNNPTPDEEMLPILQPIVTLDQTTNNSSTLQENSTLKNQQEEFVDASDISKAIEDPNVNDFEENQVFDSKGTTNNSTSSLYWGGNKQNSNPSTLHSAISSEDETSGRASNFPRQLTDGTISSQLFQDDQDYLKQLEKSCRSQAGQTDNLSKSKGTHNNTSSSLNWGLNKQNSKTTSSTKSKVDSSGNALNEIHDTSKFPRQQSGGSIPAQIFQRDKEHLEKMQKIDRNRKLLMESEFVTNDKLKKDQNTDLERNRTCTSRLAKQTSFNEIDMESIRSEVESCRDELFSEWYENEDENDESMILDPQSTQNTEQLDVEKVVQEDDIISNEILQGFLFEKPVQNNEKIVDHSERNNQNCETLHIENNETIDLKLMDYDCEEKKSISYSPRMRLQTDKSNIESENQHEENQMDQIELEHYSQNSIIYEHPQNYASRQSENNARGTSHVLVTQDISGHPQNTQERYENNRYISFGSKNIFNNVPCENTHYDVINHASQISNSYSDPNQFTGFNFAKKNMQVADTKTSSLVDANNEELKLHTLFSQSTEIALDDNSLDMVSTGTYKNILTPIEVLQESVLERESLINMTGNGHAVLQMQTSIEQLEKEISDDDYDSFVYDFETIIRKSQNNNKVIDQTVFHDVNNSANDSSVLESSKNSVSVKSINTEPCNSEAIDNSNYQSIGRSDDMSFKTPPSLSKSASVIEATRSSKDLFKSPRNVSSNSIFATPTAVNTNPKKRRAIFIPPLKNASVNSAAFEACPSSAQADILRDSKQVTRRKIGSDINVAFKPPKRLTRMETDEEFLEQMETGEHADESVFLQNAVDISEEPVAGPSSAQSKMQMNPKKVLRKRKGSNTNAAFKPATRREIEADFLEQDMKLMESGEYINQNVFLNRPSVKQLQEMTCVVEFDDNGRPVFNSNAYCETTTTKHRKKQSNKFAPPLKYGDTEKSLAMFANFQNSLTRDSSASGLNDGGYIFSLNSRPNINLLASKGTGYDNVASTSAANYFENILAKPDQVEYSKNNSADLDAIMKKYL